MGGGWQQVGAVVVCGGFELHAADVQRGCDVIVQAAGGWEVG